MPGEPTHSDAPSSSTSGPAAETRPDQAGLRRRLGRTNTTIGAILLTSLVLTGIAVLAGMRSARQQHRAEQAEAESRVRLWRAYLAQARVARLSGAIGRRAEALSAVSNAAALWVSREVRDEAIASLVLTDLQPEREICSVPLNERLVEFPSGLETYAMGSDDGDFRIFDTRNGQQLHLLSRAAAGLEAIAGRDRRAGQFQFSPDGKYFGLSLLDGAVAVWELGGGKVVFQRSPAARGQIQIRFSQDSKRFGFHDVDSSRDLVTVDLPSGTVSETNIPLAGVPFAFLPEPNRLVVASSNELSIVRTDTGEVLRRVTTPETITGLQISADARKMAATCNGTDVYLWNLDSGRLYVLRSHTERNSTLEFNPSSDRLMSSSFDNVTIFWDCSSGRELLRMPGCNGLDFSADGQRVGCLIEHSELAVFRFTGGGALKKLAAPELHDREINHMDLSPNGRWFGAVVPEGVKIWDLTSGPSGQFYSQKDARALAFLGDGKSLLLGRGAAGLERIPWDLNVSASGRAERLNFGKPEPVPLPETVSIRQVAVSLNGRTICLDLNDRRMLSVDLTGVRKPVFLSKSARLGFRLGAASSTGSGRYALSPDGRWIVVGYGIINHLAVFEAGTGELQAELPGPPGSVVFSHDGRWLVSAGGNEYQLWRVADWQPVWRRSCPELGTQTGCVGFSGDDRWLAATLSRHQVGLLEALTGETLSLLTAPDPKAITGLRLSPDGSRLVATLYDDSPVVWDLAVLRQELAPLGVDRTTKLPGQPPVSLGAAKPTTGTSQTIVWSLIAASCLAASTLLVLWHHRRLAEEFVRTEARAHEREQELEMQRELNRLKSSFVSMVSHEFRTPLGVIQSSAELLQAYYERLKPEQRAEHLADIVQCSTRMKDLMEEVLLLSRAESGRMECKLSRVELPALLRRVADETAASSEGRCPIHVRGGDGTRPVDLDESLVSMILSNLLSNAVKYSPAEAPVDLSARVELRELILTVQDRGVGIPKNDHAGLFTSFHRASNVTNVQGTGLGLIIVKRCTELHGGTISFTSAEGQGTTFVVRLPI